MISHLLLNHSISLNKISEHFHLMAPQTNFLLNDFVFLFFKLNFIIMEGEKSTVIYQRRFSENLFEFAEKVMSLEELHFIVFLCFKCRSKLTARRHKFSPVIVDVFFQKRIYFTPQSQCLRYNCFYCVISNLFCYFLWKFY